MDQVRIMLSTGRSGALVAAVAALALTSCGSVQAGAPGQAAASLGPGLRMVALADVDLAEPRFRASLPASGQTAAVAPDVVVATARTRGYLPPGVTPDVVLASATDLDNGPLVAGKVQPLVKDQLVWLVAFRARASHSGNNAIPADGVRVAAPDPSTWPICRNLLLADALTGEIIEGVENCDSSSPTRFPVQPVTPS